MSECKTCTLCCELLPVKKLNKPANTMCIHCNKGCNIYDTKPDECTIFKCAYYQMEKVSEDLRPDNCKVIFEKINDNIFFGTLHPDYELNDVVKKQIMSFGQQGISTIIMSSKWIAPKLYLSDNHTEKQIREEFQEYLNDRIKWQPQVM